MAMATTHQRPRKNPAATAITSPTNGTNEKNTNQAPKRLNLSTNFSIFSFYNLKSIFDVAVYDEIQNNRPFTFKMSKKEKAEYILGKCVWNLNDKDEFIKANNRGKEE